MQVVREKAWRDGGTHSFEHRVVRPDGEVRHLHGLVSGVLDDAGRLVRLHGTSQDITERVRAERERTEHRERQARLEGMLFAARQLAVQATDNLVTSSGAIEKLPPQMSLPESLRDAIDAVTTGLSEATRAIAELQRVIQPAAPERGVGSKPDDRASAGRS